ncbi:MAG: hypothetical protein ABW168_05815 [Sedimenticola sp.]
MQENKEDFSIDDLFYFYKDIILPWEMEWKDANFVANGEKILNKYIKIERKGTSTEVGTNYVDHCNGLDEKCDIIVFLKTRETEPFSKTILRRLRNCFAHGHFSKKNINGKECIKIENKCNSEEGKYLIVGHTSIEILKELVKAASDQIDKEGNS